MDTRCRCVSSFFFFSYYHYFLRLLVTSARPAHSDRLQERQATSCTQAYLHAAPYTIIRYSHESRRVLLSHRSPGEGAGPPASPPLHAQAPQMASNIREP